MIEETQPSESKKYLDALSKKQQALKDQKARYVEEKWYRGQNSAQI